MQDDFDTNDGGWIQWFCDLEHHYNFFVEVGFCLFMLFKWFCVRVLGKFLHKTNFLINIDIDNDIYIDIDIYIIIAYFEVGDYSIFIFIESVED